MLRISRSITPRSPRIRRGVLRGRCQHNGILRRCFRSRQGSPKSDSSGASMGASPSEALPSETSVGGIGRTGARSRLSCRRKHSRNYLIHLRVHARRKAVHQEGDIVALLWTGDDLIFARSSYSRGTRRAFSSRSRPFAAQT